jgi:hypothetical protein
VNQKKARNFLLEPKGSAGNALLGSHRFLSPKMAATFD